jgi:uncharacterized membrane protein YeaQ/YmgE (transglycosylase-associated protein family)
MHMVLALLVGLAIGALACVPPPGKDARGWGISMSLGAAGALTAALVGHALGTDQTGWAGDLFFWIVGAVAPVAVYHVATTGPADLP